MPPISSISVLTSPQGLRAIAQRLENAWRDRLPDEIAEVCIRYPGGITLRFEADPGLMGEPVTDTEDTNG